MERKKILIVVLILLASNFAFSQSTLYEKICVESGNREIMGQNTTYTVYRDCWKWKYTYRVVDGPYYQEESQCELIRDRGCGQVGNTCSVFNGTDSFCELSTLTFECSETHAERQTELCGNILSCAEGNCTEEYQVQHDATEDFAVAAATMAAAQEIASEFNFDNLTVFNGDDKKCEKKIFGLSDCCSDSGWGNDAGLTQCDSEEKELGISREEKAAHYVGKYETGSVLNERKFRVYCTYPSKLARIIVEQGNIQLGKGYGSAENPVCDGFTIDELKSIDFNIVDLSEYYEDVVNDVSGRSIGDPNQLIQDMSDKLNQLSGGE